jgi:prevent-host-death family protein
MAKKVSVVDAKRDFSELMSRTALQEERFIIERKGKAMAALVSVKDLERLETLTGEKGKKGLLAAIGAWEEHPQIEALVSDLYAAREKAKDRPVKRLR